MSDVRLVQEGLSSVLAHRAEINIVSSVDTLQARAEITRLSPQVVLFDATRPDCVEYVKGLVESVPKCKVVAFGVRESSEEFLALAPRVPVRTTVTTYPLDQAEQALADLRAGRFTGSAVVVP